PIRRRTRRGLVRSSVTDENARYVCPVQASFTPTENIHSPGELHPYADVDLFSLPLCQLKYPGQDSEVGSFGRQWVQPQLLHHNSLIARNRKLIKHSHLGGARA